MRTRYGASPWLHQFPAARRPAFPRAKGALSAEVVVIGGGLTGCAIAHAAATAGISTLLLEAGRVAQGRAGHGAGLLLTEPGVGFKELTARHGLRVARVAFAAWQAAAEQAADLLKGRAFGCGLAPQRTVVATTADEEPALRREYDARVAAGLDAAWLDARQMHRQTRLTVAGGMKTAGAFSLDPYRASLGLLAAAPKRKLQVFEKSPVTGVTSGRDGVEVTACGTTVHARTVVVATGAPTEVYGALRRHFRTRERHLALTAPLTDAQRKGALPAGVALSDMHAPAHHLHWTPDGRLLLRGAEQDEAPPASRDAVRVQRTGQLMYELLLMYPAISGLQPEYGWEAATERTADGLMHIGPHGHYQRHLFALGGEGDSVTGAFVAARVILRALQGVPEKTDEVLGWGR